VGGGGWWWLVVSGGGWWVVVGWCGRAAGCLPAYRKVSTEL